MSGTQKKHLLRFAVFALYVAVVVFTLCHHENWRDEAQAWLLARDLSVAGLIDQMAYEGHPCLWHLLLMPFAKLGFPYGTINIISAGIVFAAAAWMLWKCPFPLILQIPALFGSAFLYYMPVVARSYCLIPLFVLLCAALYQQRHQRPYAYGISIALLVQTHLYMLPMAGILCIFWFFEAVFAFRKNRDRKCLGAQALGLSLPLISFLFFLVQISGCTESSAYAFAVSGFAQWFRLLLSSPLTLFLVNNLPLMYFFSLALILPVFLALVGLLYTRSGEALKPVLAFVFEVAAMLAMGTLFERITPQKSAIIVFLVIWLLWTLWPMMTKRWLKGLLTAAYLAVCAAYILMNSAVKADWDHPYSNGKFCAEFIEENLPADAVFVQSNTPSAVSVMAYLNADSFYSMDSASLVSYAVWKEEKRQISDYASLCSWISRAEPEASYIYYICVPEDHGELGDIVSYMNPENLLYASEHGAIQGSENFSIYRIPIA